MSKNEAEIVLRATGVYKKFGRSNMSARRQLADRLGSVLRGRPAAHKKIKSGDFWSLQDISLQVQRGEVLGVIGLNGAGKSTLLRVLHGLMLPDLGEIDVVGESGALIELGAGFEASLSGRENVFIKGALMGRSREEMEMRFPEICDFAELGEFMDAPISSYSSGMRLRLAFAIASTIKPDVLLLDEIISVGDFAFKQKCRSRLNEMSEQAGVVFASHSMSDIRSVCTKAIVLNKGQIAFRGSPDVAIDYYTELQAEIEANRVLRPVASETAEQPTQKQKEVAQQVSAEPQNPTQTYKVLKETRFGPVAIDPQHYWSSSAGPTGVLETAKPARFNFTLELSQTVKQLEIGILIWDEKGNKITPITSEMLNIDQLDTVSGKLDGTINIEQFALNPGRYVTSIAISSKGVLIYRNILDEISVVSSYRPVGVMRMPARWSFSS